jgi:hypothetical protein
MAVHADLAASAAAILDRHNVPHGRIVDADRDSILFLGLGQQGCFTAWLHESRVVMVEQGFAAEPPLGLHDGKINYGLAGGVC